MRSVVVPKAARQIGRMVSKNSPTILTIMAIGGLATTVGLAVTATPKACSLIDQWEWKNGHPTKADVVKVTWKLYIPAAVMGTITIGCIIGANSINLKRNAALATAYSISEAALKEYKAKIVETLGPKKEKEVRDEIAKDRVTKNPPKDNEVILTGNGESLCYESLSGRYFKTNIDQIKKAENELARDMLEDDFISVNDVYYKLGLANTKMGDEIGWTNDEGLFAFEFSSQLTENNIPCLVLDYFMPPRFDFMDRR